jgi:hypothetical protein
MLCLLAGFYCFLQKITEMGFAPSELPVNKMILNKIHLILNQEAPMEPCRRGLNVIPISRRPLQGREISGSIGRHTTPNPGFSG